ncbi:TPA: type III secretion system effector HECT-type E3 ubiquitin transferase, partial [Salmonella enterica]|nr:type III secretion system effector HECT-type E3 ubiquitin transferase [Salmonella enterica]
MNISSSGINFSTIPFQVKKLVKTIRERTKNWFSSEITRVKNSHVSLNEKLKTEKTSPIEIALPEKIKKFFQSKDKSTLDKTLVTVKNITDTNNTCKKNTSEEDVSKITTAFMHNNIANQSYDYNYRATGIDLLPGGVSVSANNRPTVSEARTPPPVSPTPSLQATPSPSSPAGWAEKLTDAVIRQKIGEPLTAADVDFSNADFRNIKFSEVLPPCFLEPNGDIIKGFNFSNSKFTNSDISDLHFDECKFSHSSFASTNCSNTIFSNSDMSKMFLTPLFLRQQPPSFTNSTLKNSLINCGIKISGVILNKPDNSPPPPSVGYAMRLGDTWLSAPPHWNEGSLDTYLNHEHNDGNSLLMTIDSLPGKYSQEKVRAMEEVVTSLRDARLSEADIRPVESSLVSVLAHPPYTQSALIREWFGPVQERFFAHQCQTYNDVPLPAPDTYHQQRILPVLLDSFDRNSAAMTTHSELFNQVIVHCMTGEDCTDDTRQKAAALYERYLAHPAVSPHINNNGLFGDYDGSPDWTTRDADNFLLLSSRTHDTAMMLSADTLLTMLNPTPDTAWDRFYLLRGGENVSTAQISPEALFRHDFPVFHAAFNQLAQQRRFGQLIDTILSPEEHAELNRQFIAATKQKHSDVKFVDAPSQSRLNAAFEPLLPEGKLSPAHYQHILSAYNLADASPQEQAETLFCLSTAFARYSSSAIFGTENDSPTILRGYAEALMQKAYELSPAIFPSADKFTDWSNRFHGLHNAFTCTSVVAGDMQRHASEHFSGVLSSILP